MMTPKRARVLLLVTMAVAVVTLLVATAVATFGTAFGPAENLQSADDGSYSVVQGDECWNVEPLGTGTGSVENFYDYRTPNTTPNSTTYSSHGTVHLQEDDTSILFLYEGREGLSLGIVHDRLNGDTQGGAVTMRFQGLPTEGEWIVEDDNYDENIGRGPNDEFVHHEASSVITWAISEERTDGAVFRGGLDDDFAITIYPAFNDDANNRIYDGQITDWQLISAESSGHSRTSLDMDAPITVHGSPCSSYAVTELNTTAYAEPGQNVVVSATVENDGATRNTFNVTFTHNGDAVEETELTLDPGEQTSVSTSVTLDTVGTHTVGVGDTTTQIEVSEDPPTDTATDSPDDPSGPSLDDVPTPGFGVTVGLVALLAVAVVAVRRR